MTQASEILELIENVDPEDSAALGEIDARVWCWLEGYKYIGEYEIERGPNIAGNFRKEPCFKYSGKEGEEHTQEYFHFYCEMPHAYTSSRDALKSIRPQGWYFIIKHCYLEKDYWAQCTNTDQIFTADGFPTEELAELHAIIQAIEYERAM